MPSRVGPDQSVQPGQSDDLIGNALVRECFRDTGDLRAPAAQHGRSDRFSPARFRIALEYGPARPCHTGSHLFRLPRIGMGPGIRAMDAYELQGMSDAVDELLLVATGSEDRIATELEG